MTADGGAGVAWQSNLCVASDLLAGIGGDWGGGLQGTDGAAARAADGRGRTPADFLSAVLGRPVVVKLNSGVEYRGVLACLDGYMNIALEQTEEVVGGELKARYGDAFIRGNNVLYISTQKRRA